LSREEHRYQCESLAQRVIEVFRAAESASESFLSFHQKRDANHSAMIYGLSLKRDDYTTVCLFIRIDVPFLDTRWQLHLGGNIEHALGGWWELPILDVEDQPAFVEDLVLELIRTIREEPSAYRSRF
jgi:hypothetical protein